MLTFIHSATNYDARWRPSLWQAFRSGLAVSGCAQIIIQLVWLGFVRSIDRSVSALRPELFERDRSRLRQKRTTGKNFSPLCFCIFMFYLYGFFLKSLHTTIKFWKLENRCHARASTEPIILSCFGCLLPDRHQTLTLRIYLRGMNILLLVHRVPIGQQIEFIVKWSEKLPYYRKCIDFAGLLPVQPRWRWPPERVVCSCDEQYTNPIKVMCVCICVFVSVWTKCNLRCAMGQTSSRSVDGRWWIKFTTRTLHAFRIRMHRFQHPYSFPYPHPF